MSATETIDKPKTSGPGNGMPSLKHLICTCQVDLTAGGIARCGARVGGKVMWLSRAQTRPFTVCVVCRDLRDNHVPCQVCGLAP
jgi:hypothetical protein